MSFKQHAYLQPQKLRQWNDLDLNASRQETFRNIASYRSNLKGNLRGVLVTVRATLKQSAATAVLVKEQLWNFLSSISFRGNQHVWFQNIPGYAIFQQNVFEQIIRPNNLALWPSGDLANDTADHEVVVSYLLPMAPKSYYPGISQRGLLDGLWPLSMMRDAGELEFTVNDGSAWGDWAVKAGTKVVVTAVLHNLWSAKNYLPAPWILDTIVTDDDTVQFPSITGKIDSLWCTDDDNGAFTIPTGNVMLEIDGESIFANVDGQMLQDFVNTFCEDGINDIMDNDLLPLIHPAQVGSYGNLAKGSTVIITDAGKQHSGKLRYMIRRFKKLNPTQTAALSALEDIKYDPNTDKSRLRIGSHGVAQAGLSGDQMFGMSQTIV